MSVEYFFADWIFFLYKYSEMAISGDLEALKSKIFLTQRQPWWRLVRFSPPPPQILETFLRPW